MMAAANAAAKTAGGAKGAAPAAPAGFPGGPGQADPSARNVKEFVSGMIKHDYLNGFKLPDMPA